MRATVRKYLTIYVQILGFTFKTLTEHRLNFVVQLIHGPAYVIVLYLILQTVLSKTSHLAGWNKTEIMLLFATFHFLYTLGLLMFGNTIRHFLSDGIRTGEVDWILLKPLRPQFLLNFSRPELQHTALIIGALGLFGHTIIHSGYTPTLFQWLQYVVMIILGFSINYLALSTYMTLGFVVTKARQIFEFFDKGSDYAQYPVPIFPSSIQLLFVSLIPTAFLGYMPTALLLGKGELYWVPIALLTTIIFAVINQIAWHKALQHYTSASS